MRTALRPLYVLTGLVFFAACSDSGTEPEEEFEEEIEQPTAPEVGVLSASQIPAYPEALELKVSCYERSDGGVTQECPVLMWDDVTYWALSHQDNRSGLTILAFDAQGALVGTWERFGARYLWQITVDEVGETVTFWGQGTGTIEVTWDDIEI